MPPIWNNKNLKRGPSMGSSNPANKANNSSSAVEEGEIASPHRSSSSGPQHHNQSNYHHKPHSSYSNNNTSHHHHPRRGGGHYSNQYRPNKPPPQRHAHTLSRHSSHNSSSSSLRGSLSGNNLSGGGNVKNGHEEGEISSSNSFSGSSNTAGSSKFQHRSNFRSPPLNNRRGSLSDKSHRESSRDPRDTRKDGGYNSYRGDYHRQSSTQSSTQQASSSSGLPAGSYSEKINNTEKGSHSNASSSTKPGITSMKSDGKSGVPNWEPPSRHVSTGSASGGSLSGRSISTGSIHASTSSRSNIDRRSGGNSNAVTSAFNSALPTDRRRSTTGTYRDSRKPRDSKFYPISTNSDINLPNSDSGVAGKNHDKGPSSSFDKFGRAQRNDVALSESDQETSSFDNNPNRNLRYSGVGLDSNGKGRSSIGSSGGSMNENTNRTLLDSGYGSSTINNNKSEDSSSYYGPPASSGRGKSIGSSGVKRDLSAYGPGSRDRDSKIDAGVGASPPSQTSINKRFKPPPSRTTERNSSSPANSMLPKKGQGFSHPPTFHSRKTPIETTNSRDRSDTEEKVQVPSLSGGIVNKISKGCNQVAEASSSLSPDKNQPSYSMTCELLGNKNDIEKAVELIRLLPEMDTNERSNSSSSSTPPLPQTEQIVKGISDLDTQINDSKTAIDMIGKEIEEALQEEEKERKRIEEEKECKHREEKLQQTEKKLRENLENEDSSWKKDREFHAQGEADISNKINEFHKKKKTDNIQHKEEERKVEEDITDLHNQVLDKRRFLKMQTEESIKGEMNRVKKQCDVMIMKFKGDSEEADLGVATLSSDMKTAETTDDETFPKKSRSIMDLTKDTPEELGKLTSTILQENRKRAKKAHDIALSAIPTSPPHLVSEDSESSKVDEDFNAWSNMARNVTGLGNALYSEPSATPYYEHHEHTHEMAYLYIKEQVRQKNRKLKRRWVQLAQEYAVRQKQYSNKMSSEVSSSSSCGNNWNTSLLGSVSDTNSSITNDMTSMNIPYRRSRRSGGTQSGTVGTSDVVRSEYEQQQIMEQLEEKHRTEKRIKEGGSQLPRQQCAMEKEIKAAFVDNFSSRRVEDPMKVEMDQRHVNPWTDVEKCIFLDSFLHHPKDFRRIASFLKNKSTQDCVAFYYDSKQVVPYKAALKEHTMRRKKRCETVCWDATIQAALAMGATVRAGPSDEKPVIFTLPPYDNSYFTRDFHPMKFEMFEGDKREVVSAPEKEIESNEIDKCGAIKFFLDDSITKLLHSDEFADRSSSNSDTDDQKSKAPREKKRSRIDTSHEAKTAPEKAGEMTPNVEMRTSVLKAKRYNEIQQTEIHNEQTEKFKHELSNVGNSTNRMNHGLDMRQQNNIGAVQESLTSVVGAVQANRSYLENEGRNPNRMYQTQSDHWVHSNSRAPYADQQHPQLSEAHSNHFEIGRQHHNLRLHHDQINMSQHLLEQQRQQEQLRQIELEQIQHQQVQQLLNANRHDLGHPQNSQQIMSWYLLQQQQQQHQQQQQQSATAPRGSNGFSLQMGIADQNELNQGRLAINLARDDLNLLARIAEQQRRSSHRQDPRNI